MNVVEPYSRLAGVYDEIVVDPCFPQWAAFLHGTWETDPIGVHRVLDVCCGTGLIDAELISLGYAVVGVDASAEMLARARTLLGPDAILLRQTLPYLSVDGSFDAAISTFDGLNYLTPLAFRRTLKAVAGRLRPDGWLVFDLHTDAMLGFAADNPLVQGEQDGSRFEIRSDVDIHARTCDARIDVTRDGEMFTEHHVQYFHSNDDVRRALADAGFRVERVVDEYTASPARESTLRATWVARRNGRGPT